MNIIKNKQLARSVDLYSRSLDTLYFNSSNLSCSTIKTNTVYFRDSSDPQSYLIDRPVVDQFNSADLAEAGDAGDRGDDGDQGDIGDKGPNGVKGPDGAPGVNGANGMSGDPGDIGLTGIDGESGTQGLPGDTGPTGPRGITGIGGIKCPVPSDTAFTPILGHVCEDINTNLWGMYPNRAFNVGDVTAMSNKSFYFGLYSVNTVHTNHNYIQFVDGYRHPDHTVEYIADSYNYTYSTDLNSITEIRMDGGSKGQYTYRAAVYAPLRNTKIGNNTHYAEPSRPFISHPEEAWSSPKHNNYHIYRIAYPLRNTPAPGSV